MTLVGGAVLPALYRGVAEPLPAEGLHAFIREDRKPRNTGDKVVFNICFNLMIERQFGVPLVRRRALFVTGDIRQAARYAAALDAQHLGLVEPIGEFRFLYLPWVRDSIQLVTGLTDRYTACFRAWQVERCQPLLTDPGLTLAKVEAFFADIPDIDKGGFAWGGVGLRERYFAMLDGLFRSTFQRTYAYRGDDLCAAAASGAEILLFDCPEGYRIKPVNPSELSDQPAADPMVERLKQWMGGNLA